MQKIELLAPAKDFQTGKTAINYGADAVYIGANKFGARAAANNSVQEIEQLSKYAHKFNSKLFVTLNTILYENELIEAEKLIKQIYEAGADALIIQDMGILELDLPPIALHASTQTHNYDIDRIKFLDKIGFERIILARELSLDQIKEIRKETKSELEYFVHGALCVCLSGQCYFSHAVTKRSANRGRCAQLCRIPFDLIDGNDKTLIRDKHLLSLKDLNNSEYLDKIIDSGISSLKIEGRLKDVAYIKNVVSHYCQKLDAIFEKDSRYTKASLGSTKISFAPDPEKTFTRGFTNYFLNGREKEIANIHTSKSVGKRIGEVIEITDRYITIASNEELSNGDGLCFVGQDSRLKGVKINNVEGDKIYVDSTKEISLGTEIYRNYDHQFTKILKREYTFRKIDVEITLSESENGFDIEIIDEEGLSSKHEISIEKEIADNSELADKNIDKQLRKSGETIFNITKVNNECAASYFIPASTLNNLRREILELHEEKRDANYKRNSITLPESDEKYPCEIIDYKGNVINSKAKQFYLKHGVKEVQDGFEVLTDNVGKTVMTTRHCLKFDIGACPKETNHKEVSEPLYIADRNRKYRLDFDCKKCMMNIIFEGK